MSSGKRDQRVAIYSDTGTAVDGVGQHQTSSSLVGTYWCEVVDKTALNFSRASQMQATSNCLFRFIADSVTRAINPYSYWFVWRSRRFNPKAGAQPRYRDLEIEFEVEEQVSGV